LDYIEEEVEEWGRNSVRRLGKWKVEETGPCISADFN